MLSQWRFHSQQLKEKLNFKCQVEIGKVLTSQVYKRSDPVSKLVVDSNRETLCLPSDSSKESTSRRKGASWVSSRWQHCECEGRRLNVASIEQNDQIIVLCNLSGEEDKVSPVLKVSDSKVEYLGTRKAHRNVRASCYERVIVVISTNDGKVVSIACNNGSGKSYLRKIKSLSLKKLKLSQTKCNRVWRERIGPVDIVPSSYNVAISSRRSGGRSEAKKTLSVIR